MIGRLCWPVLAVSIAAVPQARPDRPAAVDSRSPVRWSASVTDAARVVHPGDRFDVAVSAELDQGWHLYSLAPVPQGPAPTIIGLPAGQAFSLSGEIAEPLPQTKYDSTFDRETSFFEDAVTFVVPVKAAAGAKPGAQPVNVAVSFQACDSHVCLPPGRVVVSAGVTVKDR